MLAALACQSVAVPEPSTAPVATSPSATVRPLVSVPVPPFTPTTVQLSPDSATKLSQAGRASVSAPIALCL